MDKSKSPSNENAHSRRFLCFRRSRLDFLGAAHPRTFLLAGKLNTAPATSIGQRQMVDHSHGSDCRSARFRLLKLGHYPPHARIADSSSKNAVNFSSARTMKRFPSPPCASTIQIVRPLESIAETQPQFQSTLLRSPATSLNTSRAIDRSLITCHGPATP